MTHKRQSIREAIKQILINADIVDSSLVFTNRAQNLEDGNLPAINIKTGEEEAESGSVSSTSHYSRSLDVEIEIMCQGFDEEAIDNTLDGYAEEIEAAMDANFNISGHATSSQLTNTSAPNIESGGDKPIGNLTLTYNITYQTRG